MPIKLILADSDCIYIEKLSAWINKHMAYRFNIEVLTNPDSCRKWVSSGRIADLILVTPMIYRNISELAEHPVMILDDGSTRDIPVHLPRVSKYQNASELMKAVIETCAESIPQTKSRDKPKYKLTIVIYLDGDTLNPIAPSAAIVFAGKNHKVFYTSLEKNQISDFYFQDNNQKGLNEMLYYIKSNKENLSMRLEVCTSKDSYSGVDYLRSPSGIIKQEDIRRDDLEELMTAISERNIYDEVVIASEFEIDDKLTHLIRIADRVIISSFNAAPSFLKLNKAVQELQKLMPDKNELIRKSALLCTKTNENSFNAELPEEIKEYRLHHLPGRTGHWPPSYNYINTLGSIIENFPG